MKSILLVLLSTLPCAVLAQEKSIELDAITCKTGITRAPIFRTLKDSVGKPAWTLPPSSEVLVVGQYTNRWAIIQRGGFKYAIPTSLLDATGQRAATIVNLAPISLPIDPESRLITYSEVVQAAGASQAELYIRAKLWFATTFNSAKDVVRADEKDAGVILGTGWTDIAIPLQGGLRSTKLWYTIKLAMKEGRYKYDISRFRFEDHPSLYNSNPSPVDAELLTGEPAGSLETKNLAHAHQHELDAAARSLVSRIKADMSKPAAGTSNGKSDW